jgi:hypothetical protein
MSGPMVSKSLRCVRVSLEVRVREKGGGWLRVHRSFVRMKLRRLFRLGPLVPLGLLGQQWVSRGSLTVNKLLDREHEICRGFLLQDD